MLDLNQNRVTSPKSLKIRTTEVVRAGQEDFPGRGEPSVVRENQILGLDKALNLGNLAFVKKTVETSEEEEDHFVLLLIGCTAL